MILVLRSVGLAITLASAVCANEALDLLEKESFSPSDLYTPLALAEPKPAEETSEVEETPPEPVLIPPMDRRQLIVRETPALHPYVQEVALRGSFDYRLNSESRGRRSGLSRTTLGFALRSFYDIELEAETAFDGDGDYLGLETLRMRYNLSEETRFSVGKFRPPFSSEYTRDPSLRWFPELSPLVAQIAPATTTGVMVESGNYKLGYFSGQVDEDISAFDGHGFFLAGLRRGSWHLDYLYSRDGSRSKSITAGYKHLAATGVDTQVGDLDFSSEFILARGQENTAWGVILAGGYWLAQDAVRLVGRYHYAASSEEGGILSGWGVNRPRSGIGLPFSYTEATMADSLHSFYLGVNVHLFEDNLLLGGGLEYRTLANADGGGEDLDSWNWNTWGRLAF